MPYEPPPLPTAAQWRSLGVSAAVELHAGKQSRVFRARVDDTELAIKLTDRHLADRALLDTRMQTVEALAGTTPEIVRPHRFGGHLVEQAGEWLVSATPYQAGESLDLSTAEDSVAMGRALAHLHAALARLPPVDLPDAAALLAAPADLDPRGRQLLHGDFNVKNIVATADGLRIFDFDDCGYGPVELDVACALYVELFDAEVSGSFDRYQTFRPAFVHGYGAGSGRPVDTDAVDRYIDVRISALARWLDNLPNAPIGIRTSSPEWLDTLRTFVRSHQH